MPDGRGNPLEVSAVITYMIDRPVEALYHINDMSNFLRNQAYDVLRRVCGKFPYRSNDPNQATLLDDGSAISKHMR